MRTHRPNVSRRSYDEGAGGGDGAGDGAGPVDGFGGGSEGTGYTHGLGGGETYGYFSGLGGSMWLNSAAAGVEWGN